MDQQAIDRLTAKSDRQMLLMELQDYRLSPIEAKAVVQRIQEYLDKHNPDQLGEGQIFYPAVAFSEPAGKPIEKCRLVQVNRTEGLRTLGPSMALLVSPHCRRPLSVLDHAWLASDCSLILQRDFVIPSASSGQV